MSEAIFQFIQCFFTVFLVTALFFIFIATNKHFNHDILRYFFAIVGIAILLSFSDAMQAYYEGFSYPTKARMFFSSLSYSLRVAALYSLLLLFIRNYQKRYKFLTFIPVIINTIISFLAFATEKVFYYTEDNELIRGPLILFPFIFSVLYFAILVYFSLSKGKGTIDNESTLLIVMFVFAITATTMEFKYRFRGILPTLIMVGVIFYYMFFLSYNYSIDQLTNAFVRTKLYEDISRIKKDYAIIGMDVNGLKKINDTKGHQAGDKCLVSVIRATRSCIPFNAEIYRIGGDEFIIIYKTEDQTKVIRLIGRIKDTIEKTGYSAAIGFAMKRSDETYDKAFNRADENMYIDKSLYKTSKNNI